MSGLGRLRAVATTTVSCAVVTVVASTAWAAPVVAEPAPVKADPVAFEGAPVSSGPWFGWGRAQEESFGYRISGDFLVQREGQPRVRVNERGTTANSGVVDGTRVTYAQQRGSKKPRLLAFDLRTGRRDAMPDAVSFARSGGLPTRLNGDVAADGPWVLLGRFKVPENDFYTEQIVAYHRGTRDLRVLDSTYADRGSRLRVGQVNGPWATYHLTFPDGGSGDYYTEVVRENLRTGRTTIVNDEVENKDDELQDLVNYVAPAVTSDGTLYYWRSSRASATGEGSTWRSDLVRRPVGGGPQVVASLPDTEPYGLEDTVVREQTDGTTTVFYAIDGDIFRLDL